MPSLNALIARHVFNLDPTGILITRIGWVKKPDTYPDYEHDGNAMLAVIAKMYENHWTLRLVTDHSHDGGWATFCCGPKGYAFGATEHPEFKEEGATLPEAVCRAALTALGVALAEDV